jgi:Kef-type K+ transport system membrane component KefB
MTPLGLLFALLAAAFLGTGLMGRPGHPRRGLASGSGSALVGFLLGPTLLGVVTPGVVTLFTPLAQVGLGWLALILGLDYGWVERRRISVPRRVAGTVAGAFTLALVATAAFCVLRRVQPTGLAWNEDVRTWIEAGGIGAACAETTRLAVRWVADRIRAEGPLTELLTDLADADDLAPMLLCGVLFALQPPEGLHWGTNPTLLWTGQIVLGAAIGFMTALLLARDFRSQSLWGVLFGTSTVAIGLAVRAELSALTVAFAMGLGLSQVSRHRHAIRALVVPIEGPLRLPALFLAGARIDLGAVPLLAWSVPAALGARILAKALVAMAVTLFSPPARKAGPWLAPSLLACGPSTLSIGLAFALRFPGAVGDTVLVCAAAATILGEVVAPTSLKLALRRAGEAPTQIASQPVVRLAT